VKFEEETTYGLFSTEANVKMLTDGWDI